MCLNYNLFKRTFFDVKQNFHFSVNLGNGKKLILKRVVKWADSDYTDNFSW